MREQLDFILTDGSTMQINTTLDVIRLVMVSFDLAGGTVGDRPRLDFQINGTTQFSIQAGPLNDTSSVVSFSLGGNISPAAVGVITDQLTSGPLPDIWFGPDLNITIVANSSGAGNFANLRVLRERTPLKKNRP